MKKFFPLCLLLIVAIVWTVSIAGDNGFLTKSSQPGPANKAPAIQKEKTVAQTEKVTRVTPAYGDINADQREEAIARAKSTLKSVGEPVPARIVRSDQNEQIPKVRAEGPAPADKSLLIERNRMKELKADGVISQDERAEYEALIAKAPSAPPLPEPLNIVSETEPNDTCTTASPINCGDTVWCASLTVTTDEEDWYTFTLTSAQNVTIETHDAGTDCVVAPSTDTRLFLYESDCTTLIASNDDINYPSNYFSRISVNLIAGTYVVLTDAYWDDGSYHLSLTCDPIVPEWYCTDDPPYYIVPPGKNGGGMGDIEPNNLCTEANPAMCEYAYCGTIADANDVDWYYVDLPADTSYGLHIRVFGDDTPNQYAYGLGLDPRVELWAPGCTTMVAYSEDYGGIFPNAENWDSQIDPGYPNCFPAGTRVYISVYTYYGDPGPYLLIINCEPCDMPTTQWSCVDDPPGYVPPDGKLPGGNLDIEPNDACADAQYVACEYAYCGDISTNTDEDWYRIVIPQDGTYGLHVRVFGNDTPNQYAQGGGLDSWVGLYKSDCTTLVVSNDDYNGTFPDAENFDSQVDPGGANCFLPGDTVYIAVNTPWDSPGPYLLIINCVPCTLPTGACCVNGECVATNLETECEALQGEWWIGEDCSAFVRCAPIGNCDNAFYNNGIPVDQYGSPASQCIYDYALPAGTADDIMLTADAQVGQIIAWTTHWNGNVGGPARYDGINVTFYLDDINTPGQPGGYPAGDCSHIQTMPGGVYSTQFVPMGMVNWEEITDMTCTTDRWMLEIFLPTPVDLLASTLYWVEIQPVMAFGAGGQSALVLSDQNIGADASQWFDTGPWGSIDGNSATCDPFTPGIYRNIAFCLIAPPPPIWSCVDDPPGYSPPEGKLAGGNLDIEPNDACADAQDVACEYAYCGDISTTTDEDWYRIVIPQDGTYGLHVRVFGNDTPNQYANGGGLDSWVGLYKSDCTTLVVSNDDYNGTFPDAERYDSQVDPGGANCFLPGDTVYIAVNTPWDAPGPYLLIINCVPCTLPTGACCVNGECVATNLETECEALQGEWWIGEDCAAFVRCGPIGNCDDAVYNNGAPVDQYGSPASQCIYDFALPAGTADDVMLTEDAQIARIITWTSHWNGNVGGPARYDGINVTFYLDDINTPGQPGGYPAGDCSHIQTMPGGVYSTQFVPMGLVNWEQDLSMTCTTDRWMLEIFLPAPVDLLANTLYWVEIQPVMAFGVGGQSAIVLSDQNIGADASQWFDAGPWGSIAGNSATCDPFTPGLYRNIAFCLIAPAGCDYAVGDVNGSGNYNGLDITYGVNFFKAIGPDPQCDPNCALCPDWFYCGDVNASCNYNGLDITYGVNYLKGIGPNPVPCADCPPIGGIAGDITKPETPSAIKTKSVLKKNSGSE